MCWVKKKISCRRRFEERLLSEKERLQDQSRLQAWWKIFKSSEEKSTSWAYSTLEMIGLIHLPKVKADGKYMQTYFKINWYSSSEQFKWTKNQTVFNIIQWVARSMGRLPIWPRVWCSKYYFFSKFLNLFNYFSIGLQKLK